MAMPNHSEAAPVMNIEPTHQTSYQFKDFGVLNTGKQSKASTATSVVVNVALIGLVLFLGTMAKKTLDEQKRVTMLTMPVVITPAEPLPPKDHPTAPASAGRERWIRPGSKFLKQSQLKFQGLLK